MRRTLAAMLCLGLGCAPETVAPPNDVGTADNGNVADVALPTDTGTVADDVPTPALDSGQVLPVDAGEVIDTPPVAVDAGGSGELSMPGPYRAAVWTGAVTGSATNARVFYPMGGGSERFPLVVFAHGFQLAVGNYDGLLAHLATHGYVVASVDYPGTLLRVDHRDVPTAIRAVRLSFARGQVNGFPALARVDATRSVAMGHSLGAKGAIMAVIAEPDSFVAAVALDPVDDNPSPVGGVTEATPSVTPEQMPRLRTPLALFGATQSRCTSLGQACAPESSNYARFATDIPMGVASAVYPLNNFGHNDFVDTACGFQCQLCTRGAAPLDSRRAALRALTVAFLGRFARGDMSLQPYIDGAARQALVRAEVLWDGLASSQPACR